MTYEEQLREAERWLAGHDEVLAPVIEAYGPCTLAPHTDYYQELVEAIIGQQLSVKAAAKIRERFLALFGGTFPSPEAILDMDPERLRGVGFSGAKVKYVRDLAEHVADGRIKFDRIDQQTNDEIIQELTAVKGIGGWTAHMFLMFCVGRLDILATGDLGIRSGTQKLYGLETLPSPPELREIALQRSWTPYESVACWYIWRSLDNMPA